eukprot:4433194-Prymnesium_polylepis.1
MLPTARGQSWTSSEQELGVGRVRSAQVESRRRRSHPLPQTLHPPGDAQAPLRHRRHHQARDRTLCARRAREGAPMRHPMRHPM